MVGFDAAQKRAGHPHGHEQRRQNIDVDVGRERVDVEGVRPHRPRQGYVILAQMATPTEIRVSSER